VTPFNRSATDSGYTVTLIGLYADSSRTIVFLHVEPDLGFPGSVSLADQPGATGSANRGAPGDYVYRLDAAPRAGADGYADLTIIVACCAAALSVVGPPSLGSGTQSRAVSL
jgi:hypothetical protein